MGGPEPGLIAAWSFDDLTVRDVSGHGHNGTLLGGARIVSLPGADSPFTGPCGADGVEFRAGRFGLVAPGQFRLELEVPDSRVLRLEVSEDLLTWRFLTNLTPANGTALWTDTQATNALRRFYRAMVP